MSSSPRECPPDGRLRAVSRILSSLLLVGVSAITHNNARLWSFFSVSGRRARTRPQTLYEIAVMFCGSAYRVRACRAVRCPADSLQYAAEDFHDQPRNP